MQTLTSLVARLRLSALALLLAGLAGRLEASLPHVRQAQALLGDKTWSRILEIENTAPSSLYPQRVHALVFELADLLWFYTPSNGTQSFSLHRGNLAAEKADFAPLLRDIHPGFERWREMDGGNLLAEQGAALPNGCFIESVAALRSRVERGENLRNPRLLSYYVEVAGTLVGHTVLAYDAPDGTAIVDSVQPHRRIRVSQRKGSEPLTVARALEGARVVRARELKLESEANALVAKSSGAEARARSA